MAGEAVGQEDSQATRSGDASSGGEALAKEQRSRGRGKLPFREWVASQDKSGSQPQSQPKRRRSGETTPATAKRARPLSKNAGGPSKATTSAAKRRKSKSEGNADQDDDLQTGLEQKLAWATKFLTSGRYPSPKSSHLLDVSKFLPPRPPVQIRMFDNNRIGVLLNSFVETSMTSAKVLFIDVGEKLQPIGEYWTSSTRDQRDLATLFNAVSNPTVEFGEAWVIGGYHSSKAFSMACAATDGKPLPLRISEVYRLSEVPGLTQAEKLENARFLAVTDNISGQKTEGYDSQPLLISTVMWRDLFIKYGRPARKARGHQPDSYKAFQAVCVSGDEKALKHLSSTTANLLTPRFKIVALDDERYKKCLTIMSSMDTRAMIGDDVVERLPCVQVPEEDVKEGDDGDDGDEEAEGRKKKQKGQRSVTVEDVKEFMRMPMGEAERFIDQVFDKSYVAEVQAYGQTDLSAGDVSFTPTVSLFDLQNGVLKCLVWVCTSIPLPL